MGRRVVLRALEAMQQGAIELTEEATAERRLFGQPNIGGLQASLTVRDPKFYERLATRGSLGAAESFMAGEWECPDLVPLVRILIRNQELAEGIEGVLPQFATWLASGWHWLQKNTRSGSRRNIAAHYDLGNEFYRLFLDDTLCYSAGYFSRSSETLADASRAKMDRLCRKLDLQPGDHLLEIGTGWGGLAMHAAAKYGCRVTTTTISREQHALAVERVREAGLQERIELLLTDYRDLQGKFDKIVSCEMIEAVGHEFLGTFFRKCAELLAPQGRMALQGIVMNDQRHPGYLRSTDFIQQYIFPGGCLPSNLSLQTAVANHTRWRLVHLEDFASGYERTLRIWRQRFTERLDEVRRLGHSEKFIRMWTYYLCYCEAAFAERFIGVVQMVWGGPQCPADATWLPLAPDELERAASPILVDAQPYLPIPEIGREPR